MGEIRKDDKHFRRVALGIILAFIILVLFLLVFVAIGDGFGPRD